MTSGLKSESAMRVPSRGGVTRFTLHTTGCLRLSDFVQPSSLHQPCGRRSLLCDGSSWCRERPRGSSPVFMFGSREEMFSLIYRRMLLPGLSPCQNQPLSTDEPPLPKGYVWSKYCVIVVDPRNVSMLVETATALNQAGDKHGLKMQMLCIGKNVAHFRRLTPKPKH
jgi:hypothetical protein